VPHFEAPVKLAYSAKNRSASIRIPYVANPKGRRVEARFPDPLMNPYLGFAALLMAGLDGVENKIHPGEAATKDLYHLPPEEDKLVPTVCHSLDQALEHPGQGPRLPDQGRCVHRQHARRLHRAQDAGSDALPHGGAPGRIRHVLSRCKVARTACCCTATSGSLTEQERTAFAVLFFSVYSRRPV
jgi:hypothetical protein